MGGNAFLDVAMKLSKIGRQYIKQRCISNAINAKIQNSKLGTIILSVIAYTTFVFISCLKLKQKVSISNSEKDVNFLVN